MSLNSRQNVSALVVGGCGFIGSHLVDLLASSTNCQRVVVVDNFFLGNLQNLHASSANPKVHIVRADACDISALEELVRIYEIEFVFNLGTLPLPHSLKFPYTNARVNFELANVMCELVRKNSHISLMHCSTSEVYGSLVKSPMDESHPYNPETPYAASKLSADFLVQSYVRTFNINAIIVRPFNNYGPRQNSSQYAGIFPSLANALLRNQRFQIFGDGSQTRDFVDVKDTVEAFYRIMCLSEFHGEVINIGTGKETSVLEIANMIIEIYNLGDDFIEFAEERPADVQRHCGSYEKLKELTGFIPHELDNQRMKVVVDSLLLEGKH